MKNKPLVSIVVVTYNSSEYVLQTLESAIKQTYHNIEIIITDDCSTDNTVALCKQWILNNNIDERRIILLEAEKNTGLTGNCNRGLNASTGEWIMTIAGDDILAVDAIEAYVNYVSSHPNVKHFRAGAIHFTGELKSSDLEKPDRISKYMYREEVTAKKQYKVITKTFFGSGPTYFVEAEALRSVGGYDERFPMQEDYPLYIKLIGKGYKMEFLDHVTVYKRIVPTSIQYDKKINDIFPKNKVRMIRDWRYEYKMEVLSPLWKMLLRYSLWIQNKIISLGNSYKSPKCRFLYMVYKVTDPFLWCDRWLAQKNKQYLSKQS